MDDQRDYDEEEYNRALLESGDGEDVPLWWDDASYIAYQAAGLEDEPTVHVRTPVINPWPLPDFSEELPPF